MAAMPSVCGMLVHRDLTSMVTNRPVFFFLFFFFDFQMFQYVQKMSGIFYAAWDSWCKSS